ncbi:DUF3427 domain-containing protein [Paenibacillus silvae]|uniref:DUF3427 domain-containing protein n=1 Tax=Paenibacillus silvae TaxID=1325358 RepID=UPI003CE9AEDC
MTQILLQPAASDKPLEHFEKTIHQKVTQEVLSEFLTEEQLSQVQLIYGEDNVPVWGVIKSADLSNKRQWDKVQKGDIALFAGKTIYASGVITLKLHNIDLAKKLWPDTEFPFEYIYFLDNIIEQNISKKELNSLIGYSINNPIQKFTVLDAETSQVLLKEYDSFNSTNVSDFTRDFMALARKPLVRYEKYSRKEVHDIFEPNTKFTPQTGKWGIRGIIPLNETPNDFVLFVTYGKKEAHHIFDEEININGLMNWQSQPKQKLSSRTVKELISHDHDKGNIYLLLRTDSKDPKYIYMGKLAYVEHDLTKEEPVYFKWQILDWDLDKERASLLGIELVDEMSDLTIVHASPSKELTLVPPPPKKKRNKKSQNSFKGRKVDFVQTNAKNKVVGDLGEKLVVQYEKEKLIEAGRPDLADDVEHSSDLIGDGLGYDIKSYTPDGEVKYIEVKATVGDIYTPYYLTLREVLFSQEKKESYYLYRIYNINDNPEFCIYHGDLTDQLELEPTQYKVHP